MPAPNLQGLNVVHLAQDSAPSQDLLLGHGFPDLSAQLDLWTNLNFTEEPLASRVVDHHKSPIIDEEEEQARSPATQEKAVRDGHVNVVAPTNIPVNPPPPVAANPLFDLNSFLAGFGLDAFSSPSAQLLHQAPTAPSLAQLLALHPGHAAPFPSMPRNFESPPPATTNTSDKSNSHSRFSPTPAPEEQTSSKRARTRKSSVSHTDSQEGSSAAFAAEDKRRRNTAASARFRLKKKEREAALEGKAKELETKVAELERECEGLRRENGWLKGLVVGVTGAAQAPSASSITVTSPPSGPISAGSKRRKDETD